jgi:hypothetical protein
VKLAKALKIFAVDSEEHCDTSKSMLLDLQAQANVSKAVIFLVVLAVFALPLAYETDSHSGATILTAASKGNPVLARSKYGDKVRLGPPDGFRHQTANFNPLFFKVDYKQNLLLWPVVAGDVTRSPPFNNPLRFSS